MINYIRLFFENLSNERKVVAIGSGLWGWLDGLRLLDVSGAWNYVISGARSFGFMLICLVGSLVFTDFYKKRISHKLFKNKNNERKGSTETEAGQAEDRA